ncbi:MAG: WbqC family protein [Prevotella sp.]
MCHSSCLLSSAYFAPIQWYQKLCKYDMIYVEAYDNFIKQTYRNRCVISTTNGIQVLTVPVERDKTSLSGGVDRGGKTLMKDIRISNHGNWRHIHWNALSSAYGESPFFEYYEDDIRPFFERNWTFLYDFNMEICTKMCELLDINPNIQRTSDYKSSDDIRLVGCDGSKDITMVDYREAIHPKHPLPDNDFSPKPYYQVFRQKNGFIPNLSILDLLFNMGNESVFWL